MSIAIPPSSLSRLPEFELDYLRRAIALADAAVARGDHPFGAIVVARRHHRLNPDTTDSDSDCKNIGSFSDEIVVEAMNSVNTTHDPSAHAELNAIRQLGRYVHDMKQTKCADDAHEHRHDQHPAQDSDGSNESIIERVEFMLFTSTECCLMCAGAIYWSFLVDRVVYACPETGLAKHAGDDFLCPCRETFARGKRPIKVEGPFLAEEAEKAHAAYWPRVFGEK